MSSSQACRRDLVCWKDTTPDLYISHTHLASSIAHALTRQAGLSTSSDILLASPADLSKKLRHLSSANIASIVSGVAKGIVPQIHRVSDLVRTQDAAGEQGEVELSDSQKVGRKGKERESSDWYPGEGMIGTGDNGLDRALGGGLRLGTLTEISGER